VHGFVKVDGKFQNDPWKNSIHKTGQHFICDAECVSNEIHLQVCAKVLPSIFQYSVRCAIESENCILISKFVRTYLFDHNIQVQRVFEISRFSALPLLKQYYIHILKTFTNLQNNAISLSLSLLGR
jgi:hypothetical protein